MAAAVPSDCHHLSQYFMPDSTDSGACCWQTEPTVVRTCLEFITRELFLRSVVCTSVCFDDILAVLTDNPFFYSICVVRCGLEKRTYWNKCKACKEYFFKESLAKVGLCFTEEIKINGRSNFITSSTIMYHVGTLLFIWELYERFIQ